jgi:hypothetical protein
MLFDRKYIIIIAILGALLLFSYYHYATTDKRVLELWGKIKGNFLNLYYLSMILSAIGFLVFFYYIIRSSSFTKSDINNLFIGLLGIVIVSLFWMPLSLKYLKDKCNLLKLLIIIVLFLVALSALYVIYILNNVTEKENKYKVFKNMALVGMIYFFIHASVFDLLMWSYNFF